MRPVSDGKELLRALGRFRKEHRPALGNFYKMMDEVEDLARRGKLFFEDSGDSFLIFHDEGRYCQFYYTFPRNLVSAGVGLETNSPKPLACYSIAGGAGAEQELEEQGAVLARSGFSFVVRNLQFTMKLDEAAEEKIDSKLAQFQSRPGHDRYMLDFLRQEDRSELRSLWESCFDFCRIPDLSHSLGDIVANRQIMVLRDKEKGQMVATQFMEIRGKNVHTQKTCVDEEYRGHGLGAFLVAASLKEAMRRGCSRWVVEVDEDNTASLRMHSFLSPKPNGTVAELWTRGVDHASEQWCDGGDVRG